MSTLSLLDSSDDAPASESLSNFGGPAEICDGGAELLMHLGRSGLRFVPQAVASGVDQWTQNMKSCFAGPADVAGDSDAESVADSVAQSVAESSGEALTVVPPTSAMDPGPDPDPAARTPARLAPANRVVTGTTSAGESLPIADRVVALEALAARVMGCTLCKALASCRTQTVFGEGNPGARFVFVGEAPAAEDDHSGRPFMDEPGQLLTKMIAAMRLRREDVYLLHTVKCRPPGNRNPDQTEVGNCRDFLEAQLQLLRPEYIICLGAVSSQALLRSKLSIGRLRQQFHEYNGSKVVVIYSPSYLRRNPEAKKAAWADLQMLMRDAGL